MTTQIVALPSWLDWYCTTVERTRQQVFIYKAKQTVKTQQCLHTHTVARRPVAQPHIVIDKYITRRNLLTATITTTTSDTSTIHLVMFNLHVDNVENVNTYSGTV